MPGRGGSIPAAPFLLSALVLSALVLAGLAWEVDVLLTGVEHDRFGGPPPGAGDVGDYLAIRLAALRTSPEAFGSTHAIEAARPASVHRERLTTSAVFGAYAGGRIVGMAAFRREDGPKTAHKGFVWGVFVDPAHRGGGAGGALMEAVVAEARRTVEQLTLAVVDGNGPAIALYRRFGFAIYGKEPRALKTEGGYADELLMALVFEGVG